MSLEDVVSLTITAETKTPTKPGFGTPLIACSKVPAGFGSAKVRSFSKLSELTDMGFLTSDPAYKAASVVLSQNPRPKKFCIGKRATATVQSLKLKALSAVQGDVYSFELGIGGGATTLVTYTVLAAATTTTVATALELLVENVTGIDSTSTTDTVTATAVTAGTLINIKNWTANLSVEDASADPGIATDLADFVDSVEDWYGLALDSNSKAEVLAAAAWTEANKKLFAFNTSDTVCTTTNTGNVGSSLKALGYKRTVGLYNGNELLSYAGAAWLGRVFPFDPGSLTWAYKDLAGVAVDKHKTSARTFLEANNLNHYEAIAGLNVTRYGKTSSGKFADETHFLDWLEMTMKIAVFGTIASGAKTPYTKNGINAVIASMKAVLRQGVRMGGLADDDALFVRGPAIEDVPAATRAARSLVDLTFGARLAGAIHSATIAGTLSA